VVCDIVAQAAEEDAAKKAAAKKAEPAAPEVQFLQRSSVPTHDSICVAATHLQEWCCLPAVVCCLPAELHSVADCISLLQAQCLLMRRRVLLHSLTHIGALTAQDTEVAETQKVSYTSGCFVRQKI
jgi:hypothetical protein